MISIKNKAAILKMETAGALLSEIMNDIEQIIRPGISTLELDSWINVQLKNRNLVSKTVGYMGYKHSSCISVNDEVVHGIPSKGKILNSGDLVKIDICASYNGYCADLARCFFVEKCKSFEAQNLVINTKAALLKGISMAVPGNRLSDISFAIQQELEKNNLGIVREFAGHGIGKQMHEDPEILNYGKPGNGPVLRAGMTFAIEPMSTLGHYDVYICEDGWTVKTKDKSLAAHVEDTILITENEPKILTRNNLGGLS